MRVAGQENEWFGCWNYHDPYDASSDHYEKLYTTPFSPASSLRQGSDRQAGPVTGFHQESNFLAISLADPGHLPQRFPPNSIKNL